MTATISRRPRRLSSSKSRSSPLRRPTHAPSSLRTTMVAEAKQRRAMHTSSRSLTASARCAKRREASSATHSRTSSTYGMAFSARRPGTRHLDIRALGLARRTAAPWLICVLRQRRRFIGYPGQFLRCGRTFDRLFTPWMQPSIQGNPQNHGRLREAGGEPLLNYLLPYLLHPVTTVDRRRSECYTLADGRT